MTTTTRSTYGTTLTATYVGRRTDASGTTRGETPWEHHLWDVTLTREGQTITIPYRMGLAHEATRCGKPKPSTFKYRATPEMVCTHIRCYNAGWQPTPPDLYDVLTALKADATEGRTFTEWCGDYGMDTDSRSAMDLYLACQASEDQSRRFFGADWQRILEDEEYQ